MNDPVFGLTCNYHTNDPQASSRRMASVFTFGDPCSLDIAFNEEEDAEGVRMGSRRNCITELSVRRLSSYAGSAQLVNSSLETLV